MSNLLSLILRHIFYKVTTLCTTAAVIYSWEDMFVFDTHNLFRNVPYKRTHTNEPAALSRSWKKTATAIRVSVSKFYVSLCGAAAKLKTRVTVC